MKHNNNNEDYLWDGSGKPDKEVQHLEKLLGQFKYEKKELQIKESQKRVVWSVYTRFALVAATILITLSGLWLLANKSNIAVLDTKIQIANKPNIKATSEVKSVHNDNQVQSNQNNQTAKNLTIVDNSINNVEMPALKIKDHQKIHHNSIKVKQVEVAINSEDESKEAAKQLLLALQIASTKLNIAQKRVQENSYQ